MSFENEYKKLLGISTFIGLIGSLVLFMGMFIDFIQNGIKVLDLAVLAWVFGIAVIMLITFFGAITRYGIIVNDERPGFFMIALYIFAPTFLISQHGYNTPLYYILNIGNELIGSGSVGFIHYLIYAGTYLLLITFMFFAWIFLWKNRFLARNSVDNEFGEFGFVVFLRVVTSLFTIVAGVGIILGMITPITKSSSASLLMFGDGSQFDLSALAFIILIAEIMITALIVLMSNINKLKIPKNELPLLTMLLLVMIFPGYTPHTITATIWSAPIFKLLEYGGDIYGDIAFMGWVLIIGVLVLILSFMFGLITYFFKTSVTVQRRATRDGISSPKKVKLPKSPPTIGSEGFKPSGTLASQLTGTSPPAMPLSQPPLMATKTSDKPTCPFCGKDLSYIDEYQRWYCYSCNQYV